MLSMSEKEMKAEFEKFNSTTTKKEVPKDSAGTAVVNNGVE